MQTKKTPRSRKKMSKKLRTMLIVAGVLMLGAGAYATWWYVDQAKKAVPAEERPLTKQEVLRNELINSVVIDGEEESDVALKKAVAAAKNDEQRAEYYLQAAAYMYSTENATAERQQKALSYAEEAYKLHATPAAAKMALDIARDLKRQELIDKYQPIFDAYMKDVKDLRQGAPE